MSLSFLSNCYDENHDSVSYSGISMSEGDALTSFLKTKVAERLDDSEAYEEFESHLNGLNLTGMGTDCLKEVLQSSMPEARSWAAGEALVEAYVAESEGVIFPWNMERDKRNPMGSLPGADIIGFMPDSDSYRLVIGEVKTSSEEKYPPQVMSGRSGHLGHQIDKLCHDLRTIHQLLKWLLPRVKGTEFQEAFNESCTRYLNSDRKDVVIVGALVRDTKPNSNDLSGRASAIQASISTLTSCMLIAIHLPWGIDKLISYIREGDAA